MPRCNNLDLKKCPIFCNNLGFGEQGEILSKFKSAICICPDVAAARGMKAQLDALNKPNALIDDFDKPFTLSKFSSNDNKLDQLNALFTLATTDAILISTAEILFSFLPNFEEFKKGIIELDTKKDYDLTQVVGELSRVGYKRTETVTARGEFALRGDVLDVFDVAGNEPVRVIFFDTQIEEMYSFDALSFEKKEKLNLIKICPADFVLGEKDENEKLIKLLSKHSNASTFVPEIIGALERGDSLPLEFFSASSGVETLTNFGLPIVITDAIKFSVSYNKLVKEMTDRIEFVFKSTELVDCFTKKFEADDVDKFFLSNKNNLVFFDNFDLNSTDLKTKLGKVESIDYETVNFPSLLYNLDKIEELTKPYFDKKIYLCLSNKNTAMQVEKIFLEKQIPYSKNKNSHGLILTELDIPYNICFKGDEVFYIGSTNFAHKKELTSFKQSKVKYLPKAGEYVVHSVHGIGKCLGVVNMNVSGVDKEFFRLEYRGGDSLYVPTESADCLSLYMAEGGSVTLNKLGGKEFAREKLRAQKSIEDMSGELLEIYAKRKASKGFKFEEDDYLYTEFENAFKFTETADQLQAIQDVKRDMISAKVMDRLICGDVGFGKTEVAMRAMFKAVQSRKQVAILAPTTILSLQHYLTATERGKDFGVRVEMLNRFKTPAQQKAILKDLADGKIDVVCGTHRLLSADVHFADLGLLILDEEQRFGVKAKEQIKKMKANVDVLTLSATPIPRTLSMSLMNIRDISIINTPPVDRLPVKTYVMEYNEEIVAKAIDEELARDGQVLVVYNNIEKLPALVTRLKERVSNKARFDIAHGQMSEVALENAIKRLYDKETNVFVSTTLIENGVDLPKANTLIVLESDHMGLSQMYQLRGRVGRSTTQAYAYFTFASNKALTEDSANRLQALAENTDLGSGFKIAMRDLQIRGAGELLGKVQHGHMVKIGYELYTKLLNDTIRKLRGEKVEIEREIKLDIAISSKIPYSFVEDESERVQIIAKISNVTSKDSARATLNDLLKKYGKLPKEIYQLTYVALLKALAVKNNVKNITINQSRMSITFYENVDVNAIMKKLISFNHFKFEQGALPTIKLSPNEFSPQTAETYMIEFFSN